MRGKINFVMQHQIQGEWCWAAVSVSVGGYYGTPGPSGGFWQQCEMANAELGQSTCCANGSTTACNQPWYLDLALTRIGHLAALAGAGPSSYIYVQTEVNATRPVGVRIGWAGGGGHFVIVSGFDDDTGTEFIDVEDPWYGPSTADYTSFCTRYQGFGTWTHTYPINYTPEKGNDNGDQ